MDEFATPAHNHNHTHTIAALYTDPNQAVEAVEALRKEGFSDTAVRLTRNPADIDTDTEDHDPGFWDKLMSWFKGDSKDTELYREGVRRGGSLVTVHTTEDMAGQAINILDYYAPADLDEHARQWGDDGWQARDIGAEAATSDDADLYDRRDATLGNNRVRGFVRGPRDTDILG